MIVAKIKLRKRRMTEARFDFLEDRRPILPGIFPGREKMIGLPRRGMQLSA